MKYCEVFKMRNADHLFEATLCVWIRRCRAKEIVFTLMRRHQKTSRANRLSQLILRQHEACRVFVSEERKRILAERSHRRRVPVEMREQGIIKHTAITVVLG